MEWSESHIRHLVQDLAEENALACRAMFKLTDIIFSDNVETLSVTVEKKPTLYINKGFVSQYAQSEADVKVMLLHEYLHILLRHTEQFKTYTLLLNIALDAVINAIIYRIDRRSSIHKKHKSDPLFSRIYPWNGLQALLRPQGSGCSSDISPILLQLHEQVYSGSLGATELYEILIHLLASGEIAEEESILFIGSHEETSDLPSPEMAKVIEASYQGLHRNPLEDPIPSYQFNLKVQKLQDKKWRTATLRILRKCLIRDNKPKSISWEGTRLMPYLSSHDRHAISRQMWTGLLAFSHHVGPVLVPNETVHIYLDTSGSIMDEVDQLVALLHTFRNTVRMRIWAFSDSVAPAKFHNNKFEFDSSGGTQIGSVFDHIRVHKPKKAVIVTDGHIGELTDELLLGIEKKDIDFIISSQGTNCFVENSGMQYYKLDQKNV